MPLGTNELSRDLLLQIGTGALFLIGLWREWWVMGAAYRDIKAERDRWRELYLSLTRSKSTK